MVVSACLRMRASARLTRVSNSSGSLAACSCSSTNPRIARDQSRAHTVPHHVTNENAGGFFSDWKNVKEIATDIPSGKVQTEKPQRALVNGNMRGNGRKLLW